MKIISAPFIHSAKTEEERGEEIGWTELLRTSEEREEDERRQEQEERIREIDLFTEEVMREAEAEEYINWDENENG